MLIKRAPNVTHHYQGVIVKYRDTPRLNITTLEFQIFYNEHLLDKQHLLRTTYLLNASNNKSGLHRI